MLKLTVMVKRLAHLSPEAFEAHWRDVHGPLVLSHSETLGIRRYVQTSPLANPAAQEALRAGRGALEFPFDGCAELWWDSLEAHLAARNTEAGARALQALIEDERTFVDLSQSQLWYGAERAVVSPGSSVA